MKKIKFNSIKKETLCQIETDEWVDLTHIEADYIRLQVPATIEMKKLAEKSGLVHADRLLKAAIRLQKKFSYEKMLRLPVKVMSSKIQEIKDIAHRNFPTDRRFHVAKEYNNQLAFQIIDEWIENTENAYVVTADEKIAGFLICKDRGEDEREIFLAATDEKYRMLGTAASLYAKAVIDAKEEGKRTIFGVFSTSNVSVMNLYAAFGANFSDPLDIYLK